MSHKGADLMKKYGLAEEVDKFPVGPGILTPAGMRQRYLTGRHDKARYSEQYQLISSDYVQGEIYI